MGTPRNYAKFEPTRSRPWFDKPTVRLKHSVAVTGPDGFTEGYERNELAAEDAIAAVEKHIRFLVAHSARAAGRYVFLIVGTTERREITLNGPRKAHAKPRKAHRQPVAVTKQLGLTETRGGDGA